VPKRKIHFIGFLANVDDSILKLNLEQLFTIERKSQQDIIPFLRHIDMHWGVEERLDFSAVEKQGDVLMRGQSFYCITARFESFELSYEIHDRAVAFLLLMIGLESMFTREREGFGYALSRNTAVFLGETKEKSREIFEKVKNFYRKRGYLVHEGKMKDIGRKDVLDLRNYVRNAIKEMNTIGKSKKEVLETLKACGY